MKAQRIAAFALAVLCAAGCGGDEAEVGPTAAVEAERIERLVVATGTIEPEHEVEIRPRIAGIIEKVMVKAGDDVVVGQPLVEIERALLESHVREAQAAAREARVERRYAEIELRRAEELEKRGAASSQQMDDARSRFERAEASVARAQANLDSLSTQLGYATVVSSIEGRVLDVPAEQGTAVSPVTAVTGGTLLMSLAGTDTLFLEGLVDENQISRVELEQPARVRTEAFADRIFEGRVREIAPLGKRIQNVTYFEVKIAITDPDASLLRPRMSGDADIIVETVDGALTIPETALRYRGDKIFVDARNGDRGSFEPRDIEIGIVDGTRVQVLAGLEEGDEVRLQ